MFQKVGRDFSAFSTYVYNTHNMIKFPRDINSSYIIINLRMNFWRDSRFPYGTNCVEAKELSLTRKTRAQPWKYYIYHFFYFASIFHLTFFLLLWQVRNQSLFELSQIRLKEMKRKRKKTNLFTCVRFIVSLIARSASNGILYYRVTR